MIRAEKSTKCQNVLIMLQKFDVIYYSHSAQNVNVPKL